MLRIAHDRRAVDVGGHLPAERLIQQVVLRRRREILGATDNVRNAHQMVVHDVCKVIGGKAVGLEQHLILKLLVFDRDVTEGGVMERGRALVRDALADDKRLARLHTSERLVKRQVAAGADVLANFLTLILCGRFFLLTLLAEAVVCAALFAKELCILAEQVTALGLDIGADRAADIGTFVVVKTAFRHRPVDHVRCALDQTALIGVLDAQDERAALTAGDQPRVKRRAQIADVHIARGTGCKAGAHLAARNARFHLIKKVHKNSSVSAFEFLLSYRFHVRSSMIFLKSARCDCETDGCVIK